MLGGRPQLPVPASPKATGGEGTFFEQRVCAYFMGLLLTKGVSPCFPDAWVTEVRFQTRNDEWHTDDLLIQVQDGTGVTRKLAMQIKLAFTVSATESNKECREVISGAWRDFNNSKLFHYGRDLLSIVVLRTTHPLISDFRSLLNCADTSRTSEDFAHRIATEGNLSQKTRDQYDAISKIIREAESSEPSKIDIWQFIRSFRLQVFDFDSSAGQAEANIINHLAGLTVEPDRIARAKATWEELLRITGEGIPNAASYTYEDLPQQLRGGHRVIGAHDRRPLRQLTSHANIVINRISTVIANDVHIDRSGLAFKLMQQLDSSNLVVLTGAAGSGKSAVAREVFDVLSDQAHLFAFRAEEFATAHLDDTLNRAQVKFQSSELFDLLKTHDRKIMLIDSVERLLEKPDRDAFSDLLALVFQDPTWQLILTCREYSLETFCSALLTQVGMPHAILKIPLLTDSELAQAEGQLPSLKRPLANKRLRGLLRNPYLLGMAAKIEWPEPETMPNDERAFRVRVWKDIIKKDSQAQDSLPTRRGTAFKELAVRRARALVPFTPCADLDIKVLDALQSDGLIEYQDDSKSTAAPAHDVLEDWAILEWTEERYIVRNGDYLAFLTDIGSHPAIRRAYRRWLSGFVVANSSIALDFAISVAFDEAVPHQTRDDTLISLMLSKSAEECLRQSRELVAKDDFRLLHRLIHLLRVGCMAPPPWLANVKDSFTGAFHAPIGKSWPVILEFVAESLDDLLPEKAGLVLGLLKDWSKSVSLETPEPDGFNDAGIIAPRLLSHFEEQGYQYEDRAEQVLEVILKIPKSCDQKFLELINRACADDLGDHIAQKTSAMVLQELHSNHVCRDFPDDIINLANARWVDDPRDEEHANFGRRHGFRLANVFGLSHRCDLEFSGASASRGPFLPLLKSHPEKAIQFIIDFINYSVQSYARDDSKTIESPWEVELHLRDGQRVAQWCNGRLWQLYRASSVGPDVLQSALMALESWLLEKCEQGEDVRPILDRILSKSNNVCFSAVVASVATAYPKRAGEAALPLLGYREFIHMDLERMVKDLVPLSRMLNNWPQPSIHHEIFHRERERSDALPHRRLHLENLATLLQFGPSRDEVDRIIDNHLKALASPSEQSEKDKVWRLALHRMDLRKHKLKGNLEDGVVEIQAGALEDDLQQMVHKNVQGNSLLESASELRLWGIDVFLNNSDSEERRGEWKKRLEHTMDSISSFDESNDRVLIQTITSGISHLSAICIRDHWDALDTRQRQFCIDSVLSAVTADADSQDQVFNAGQDSTGSARPAAFILPLLLCKELPSDLSAQVKTALALALTHACTEVMDYAAEGIGNYLWDGNPTMARYCVGVLLRRAELVSCAEEENHGKPHNERRSYQEIFREANLQIRQPENVAITEEPKQILFLNLCKLEHRREIQLLLNILGHSAAGDFGAVYMKHLSDSLALSWDEYGKKASHVNPDLDFELASACLGRLARFCLDCPSQKDSLQICESLLGATEQHPGGVAEFLQYLTEEEDRYTRGQIYWFLWQTIGDKVLIADWAKRLGDGYSQEKKLLDALFLVGPWKDETRNWNPLENNSNRIDDLFLKLPLNSVSLENYLRYLYHVGEKSLPHAFTLIWQKLNDDNCVRHLEISNVSFYLESLLRRFVYGKPVQLKAETHLRNAVLSLLDGLVESGSSPAYIMRDDFVTPMATDSK